MTCLSRVPRRVARTVLRGRRRSNASPLPDSYTLWVQDSNLYFGVTIRVKSGSLPSAATLRAAASNVAKATLPKLRG